jgi:hypothetical protein
MQKHQHEDEMSMEFGTGNVLLKFFRHFVLVIYNAYFALERDQVKLSWSKQTDHCKNVVYVM